MAPIKKLYFFDPISNTKQPTTYQYVSELLGYSIEVLRIYKVRRKLLNNINCYLIDDSFTKEELKALIKQYSPEEEFWKNIDNDGIYQVSHLGRIRRTHKIYGYRNKDGSTKIGLKKIEPEILIPYVKASHRNKTLIINLTLDGKRKELHISKLVANAFVENENNYKAIIHKDGNKYNNRADNLEWASLQKASSLSSEFRETNVPVLKIDSKTGEIIDEYESTREAAKNNYMGASAMRERLRGNIKKQEDYRFIIDTRTFEDNVI